MYQNKFIYMLADGGLSRVMLMVGSFFVFVTGTSVLSHEFYLAKILSSIEDKIVSSIEDKRR